MGVRGQWAEDKGMNFCDEDVSMGYGTDPEYSQSHAGGEERKIYDGVNADVGDAYVRSRYGSTDSLLF